MNESFLEPILRKMRIAKVLPILRKFSECKLMDAGCSINAKVIDILCLLFIVLAIITRIAIYIYNPNFWMDEAMLAQSIFLTDFKDILYGNLPSNQVAPLGFLLSVKVLSFCFGYSEYVLRIIPLLAGILIFPIAYSFAIREFDKKFACVFLFFLTISPPLLFYNIQFKQYATEILVSLIYLNSFCLNRKTIIEKAKIPYSLVLIAPVGMFFSNASIFVLAGLFALMLFEQRKAKQIKLFLRNNWLKILIIVAILLCYYLLWLSQIKGIKSGFMDNYWKMGNHWKVNYMIVKIYWMKILLKNILCNFIDISYNLFLNYILFASLFFFGLIFLFREKRYIFFAIVLSIFFHFVAYLSGKYPLISNSTDLSVVQPATIRLFVYIFPIVLIVPSFAIFKLLESEKFRKLAFFILIAMPCFAFYFSYQKITSGLEIIRISELIETIEDENSAAVVYRNAVPSYIYYQFLRGKDYGKIYLLSSLPANPDFFKFPNYSIILIKPNLPFEAIFEELKSKNKKKAYFIFSFVNGETEFLFYQCYLYVKNNFPPEKTFFYKHRGVSAILVEFE